ncbi:DNA cytosine methyltransferase [Amycolatopsis pittospori]|uniref:DNA cytosine methyltransferase n=1 Tax=Amycolatopsis pittospori TaxID=2749434 RepID=UPI0015EFE39D|nr:DNA cytosine methyltransferase [Amycolatopsis pittospori]
MADNRAPIERTSVELFAGGGGLAMAVHRAGFRPLLLNEYVKHACDTLEANGAVPRGEEETVPEPGDPWPLVRGDVRDLKMGYLQGAVDLLAGGPPCQPFSLGGVAKGDEDKRNMFPEMFRAIREIQPKAVICENVRGLLRPSFKPYFDYILRELELPFEERDPAATWLQHDAILRAKREQKAASSPERYRVFKFEVNAADYGVPQIRNRVLIVAFRGDLDIDEAILRDAVKKTHSEEALRWSLISGEYWERHQNVPKHVRNNAMKKAGGELPLEGSALKPWRTLRDAIAGFDGEQDSLPQIRWDKLDRVQYDDMPLDHVGWPDARIYDGHTPNVLDRPAKTVKAGVHGVPGGESVMLTDSRINGPKSLSGQSYRHRYMTVRETARVMTFPDDWKLSGPRGEKMRQLGNAVPVLLGEVFAKAVAKVLDEVESRT